MTRAIDRLVLDPLATLHCEPDRLISEEVPPAVEVRPLLDAIGGGAHRVSEIVCRIGRPATSLATTTPAGRLALLRAVASSGRRSLGGAVPKPLAAAAEGPRERRAACSPAGYSLPSWEST